MGFGVTLALLALVGMAGARELAGEIAVPCLQCGAQGQPAERRALAAGQRVGSHPEDAAPPVMGPGLSPVGLVLLNSQAQKRVRTCLPKVRGKLMAVAARAGLRQGRGRCSHAWLKATERGAAVPSAGAQPGWAACWSQGWEACRLCGTAAGRQQLGGRAAKPRVRSGPPRSLAILLCTRRRSAY